MRIYKIVPHAFMLLILASAEGFRLFEFYKLLTNSSGAAIASALITVLIVVYLALYELITASLVVTIICMFLSLGSFLEPYKNLKEQRNSNSIITLEKEKRKMPELELKKYRSYKDYRESYKADVKIVQEYNSRIDEAIKLKKSEAESFANYIVFFLGVVILALGVPFLTFIIAHKLSVELKKELKRIKKN